jgi:hypothetical protein
MYPFKIIFGLVPDTPRVFWTDVGLNSLAIGVVNHYLAENEKPTQNPTRFAAGDRGSHAQPLFASRESER